MIAIDRAINIDDLKRLAKRRPPKIMFDKSKAASRTR
jgi:hypothetical protein